MMINLKKRDLYPLLFEPAYNKSFWGGAKFRTMLERPLPPDCPPVGISWEICDRPNFSSPVANGALAGATLKDLVETFRQDLVGKNFAGGPFPMFVRLIDATQRTALHVHPTEEFCENNEFCEPKTEMLYVMQADKGARVFAGLKSTATRQAFISCLRDPEVEELLQDFESVPGDAFFLPGGRVHALGAGNLALAISGNSNTVFRLSDWNREDENGERRELNIRDALACIDFTDRTVPRICGASNASPVNRKYPLINRCPSFHCDELMLVDSWRDTTGPDVSFHILTAVSGPFSVGNERFLTHVKYGESVLIPACFGNYVINVPENKETDIIRTTL